MLNDNEFIIQSLNSNLFFLRTTRFYCLNIELSFFKNNMEYSNRAKELGRRCEELGRKIIDYTYGYIPEAAKKYQIYVTDYSLRSELLTEKLFDVDIDTGITEEQLNFKVGVSGVAPESLINNIIDANNEALEITVDFLSFAEEIRNLLITNELFSYSYPELYNFMMRDVKQLQDDLTRIMERLRPDPVFSANSEFTYNTTMLEIVLFLRGFIDISEVKYLNDLNYFILSYPSLIRDYQTLPLTPENQKELTERSIAITERLRNLIAEMLERLLNAELYFIVEATMIDNFYTNVNYFYYLLKENESIGF